MKQVPIKTGKRILFKNKSIFFIILYFYIHFFDYTSLTNYTSLQMYTRRLINNLKKVLTKFGK